MGICCSCLKARDKGPQPQQPGETQPLLADSSTADSDNPGDDELSLQRQEELANIVHMTHEYFIDVSAISNAPAAEQQTDYSALLERISEREQSIKLPNTALEPLSDEERERLEHDIKILQI